MGDETNRLALAISEPYCASPDALEQAWSALRGRGRRSHLRRRQQVLHRVKIADATRRAPLVFAFRGFPCPIRLVSLLEKVLPVNLVSHYFPRQFLILCSLPEAIMQRETCLLQRLQPPVEAAVFAPSVEPGPPAPGSLYYPCDLPAPAGDDALDGRICRLVVADGHTPSLQSCSDPVQLLAGCLDVVLPLPLERCVGLGNEGGEAQSDIPAPRIALENRSNLLDQLGQFLKILLALRRMADHEVELHAGPTSRHCPVYGRENVFLRDPLVDHVTQPLASGLRSEGEARLPHPTHRFGEPHAEGIRPQ